MNASIQEPVKGTSFASITSWAREVTRAVNAFAPFVSPGMLMREGVAGFGAEPLPVNRRGRQPAAAAGRVVPGAGCFALLKGDPSEESYGTLTDLSFVNQYWIKGNRPFLASFNDSVSSLVGLTVGSTGTPSLATPYVALKVPATPNGSAALAAYATFAALQTAAADAAYNTVPLYLFSATASSIEVPEGDPPQWAVTLVADCDFRNAPRAQVIEVL